MSDLDGYVEERKKKDKGFAEGVDEGYERFKISTLERVAKALGKRIQIKLV